MYRDKIAHLATKNTINVPQEQTLHKRFGCMTTFLHKHYPISENSFIFAQENSTKLTTIKL